MNSVDPLLKKGIHMILRSPVLHALFLLLTVLPMINGNAVAGVVINEIFYNAPDELKELEYIELQNTSDQAVDVSGWKLSGEIKFKFPAESTLKPGQIIVLAKDARALREFYKVDAHGEFKKSLSNSGGRLTLKNADGIVVESMTYGDKAPWPIAADGYSASIERISVTGSASDPANWAPSKLSDNYDKTPSGTPGARNSVAAKAVPPRIDSVEWNPKQIRPGQTLEVKVKLSKPDSLESAEVRYRHAGPGDEGKEQALPLTQKGDALIASIPAGKVADRLLRFRVIAKSKSGGVGYSPHPNEVRPAFTVYVSPKITSASIPIAHLIFVGKKESEAAEQYRKSQSEPARRDPFGGGFRRGGFRPRRDFRRPRGRGGFRGFWDRSPATPLLPQGKAALIYTAPKTGETKVFDFINVVQRKSGWKIRLHKDRLLDGMKSINVVYESDERTVLNETLAYQLYELAGNKTCKHGFTRVMINGSPAGYHFYFEQPNGTFFRRNRIDNDGDLYKLIWMGNAKASPRVPQKEQTTRSDIVGRYEKKTNRHHGHQDLVAVIEALESAKSDEETWRLINKHFDVEQVINYFAVNSLISHWDGFFNNFFAYYDRKGTGKWTLYPWDQDSTWSQRGGRAEELYEMPLFFGAEGATPKGIVKPSSNERERSRGRFGGFPGFGGPGRGISWWRNGGDFSRPMLANPTFYKRFKARLDELTTKVFNEKSFGPRIDALKSLEPEIRLRAKLRKVESEKALAEFHQTLAGLHKHLSKRRAFVRGKLKSGD